MALSENLNVLMDDKHNFNSDSLKKKEVVDPDSVSVTVTDQEKTPGNAKEKSEIQKNFEADQDFNDSAEHEWVPGNSLFIFTPTNPVRVALKKFVNNSYFAGFIYHMIAFNSLLLALDEPSLTDSYQQKTIEQLLNIISIIFVVEFVVKVIVSGFVIGEKTYLKDYWNILDFIIVMFSILTWTLEAMASG